MSESLHPHQYTLMCLRMAAECKNLAAEVPIRDLKARYLCLSRMWRQLSVTPRVLH